MYQDRQSKLSLPFSNLVRRRLILSTPKNPKNICEIIHDILKKAKLE